MQKLLLSAFLFFTTVTCCGMEKETCVTKQIEDIEALEKKIKEEMRLMRERESKELDGYLGGTELLNKNKKEEFESEEVDDFDKDINFDEEDED